MVTVIAAVVESCGENGCGASAGASRWWALAIVAALTVMFTLIQARRTTLRRGRGRGHDSEADQAPRAPRPDDS